MASLRLASSSSVLPRLSPAVLSSTFRFGSVYTRQLSLPALPSVVLAIPASISWSLPSLPSLLGDIWESILKAVPKKKTSHSKKRHRQMAGKALKDVTSLCKCPACGQTKRMHYLCPHCLESTYMKDRLAANMS
jgi:large subunit ribosomal protein L32